MAAAEALAKQVKELSKEYSDVPTVTFGPFEAAVYKVDGRYRMRMIVKCVLNRRSREMFSKILAKNSAAGAKKPALAIDFNPTNL